MRKETYLNHLLLGEIALLGLLDGMRQLSKGGCRTCNAAHLGCSSHVGGLLGLLLEVGRL